jgi:fructokinase
VSRVGADSLGDEAFNLIESLGVPTELLQRDSAHPTGTVHVLIDPTGNPTFTIIPDVAYDYIEVSPTLAQRAAGAALLCFGSLSQRTKPSRETLEKLIDLAPSSLKFFDVNLRKDCFSADVLSHSLHACDIVKLNHEELSRLAEFFDLQGKTICELAESLLHKFNVETVLVTLAERGAFTLSASGSKVYVPGYDVKVVDAIGSGDAFSAAFCNTVLQGGSLIDACELGNKLGALVACTKGATAKITAQQLSAFGPGERRVSEPSLMPFVSGASAEAQHAQI